MQPMPSTRHGRTHKLKIGEVSLYVTVNRDGAGAIREVFSKADEGHNHEADGISIMASLAMRHGCPAETVVRHLRFRRYPPFGGPGQPLSISDAIGLAIEREIGAGNGGADNATCTEPFSRCLDCDDHNRCSRYADHRRAGAANNSLGDE